MRRIVLSLILVIVAAAAYLLGGIAHPTTTPVKPTTPDEPNTCPSTATIVTVAPAVWQRRGDPCPNVIVTTTAGGEST